MLFAHRKWSSHVRLVYKMHSKCVKCSLAHYRRRRYNCISRDTRYIFIAALAYEMNNILSRVPAHIPLRADDLFTKLLSFGKDGNM